MPLLTLGVIGVTYRIVKALTRYQVTDPKFGIVEGVLVFSCLVYPLIRAWRQTLAHAPQEAQIEMRRMVLVSSIGIDTAFDLFRH